MKKFNVVFFVFVFIFMNAIAFAGCSGSYTGINGTADPNINMSPRQISAVSANDFEAIIDIVRPAVVGISAIYGNTESVGSGVAVSQGGYILTNHHVVDGANAITVYYANKTSGSASLVWSDSAMDLAVIRATIDIPYLEIGDSDLIHTGQDVIAIGTPLTLEFKHTVTKGIISALDRTIEIDNEDGSTSYLQNLIQHDASINPGNSGGPVINSDGQVIGINTLKVTEAEGIGFAIPIKVAVPVLSQIVKYGTYETPYLGMFGLDSSIARFYGRTLQEDGVYVVSIDESGPMAQTGIKKGDIIIKIGDIDIKTMLDLRTNLYNYIVGEKVPITYIRDGATSTTTITLTKRS